MYYSIDIPRDKKIVVFGAGETAKKLCEDSSIEIACFVDNDPQKWDTEFCGKAVKNPDILSSLEHKDNIMIFIASQRFDEIACQLSKMGFTERNYENVNKIQYSSEIHLPLKYIQGPLYTDEELGKYVKKIMLTPRGKDIRKKFPQYKPTCRYFPDMIVVLSDGSVTTCCMDWQGKNSFGNLYKEGLEEIWFREIPRLTDDLYNLEICRSCIGQCDRAPLISSAEIQKQWQNISLQYPVAMQIEIMGACNYQCSSCMTPYVSELRSPKPDLDILFERIRPFLSKIKHINLFNHGEPLLHPDFCDFILACRKESEQLVMMLSTNGILLDDVISKALVEARVDQVIVSTHGGPGTDNMLKYSKINADYEKVIHNTKRLLEIRERHASVFPKVTLKTVLFEWNDTDELMDQFRKDAAELGLKAASGNQNVDNYCWVTDVSGLLSSKRFVKESEEYKTLVKKGEIQETEWFWNLLLDYRRQ